MKMKHKGAKIGAGWFFLGFYGQSQSNLVNGKKELRVLTGTFGVQM